jgi:CheY-like chemotaxis protein
LNAAASGDGLPSARTKTLLVVEDNVLVRHAVADALRYAGYTVLEASTAEEAKAVLTAVPVDLLFADLNIPARVTGFSVAQFARECCPSMPLIFTSGTRRGADARPAEGFRPVPSEAVSHLEAGRTRRHEAVR